MIGGGWRISSKIAPNRLKKQRVGTKNHGNFCNFSRWFPQEVAVISSTFLGDFWRKVPWFLSIPSLGTITFLEAKHSQLAFFYVVSGRFWGLSSIFHQTSSIRKTFVDSLLGEKMEDGGKKQQIKNFILVIRAWRTFLYILWHLGDERMSMINLLWTRCENSRCENISLTFGSVKHLLYLCSKEERLLWTRR